MRGLGEAYAHVVLDYFGRTWLPVALTYLSVLSSMVRLE